MTVPHADAGCSVGAGRARHKVGEGRWWQKCCDHLINPARVSNSALLLCPACGGLAGLRWTEPKKGGTLLRSAWAGEDTGTWWTSPRSLLPPLPTTYPSPLSNNGLIGGHKSSSSTTAKHGPRADRGDRGRRWRESMGPPTRAAERVGRRVLRPAPPACLRAQTIPSG
jgi:hypothetical protein